MQNELELDEGVGTTWMGKARRTVTLVSFRQLRADPRATGKEDGRF